MTGFYSVLLVVILCGTVSAAEKSEGKRALSFFADLSKLRGLYAGFVRSKRGDIRAETCIKEVVSYFSDQNQMCKKTEEQSSFSPNDFGDESDGEISDLEEDNQQNLLLLLLPGLICGKDKLSREAIEKRHISTENFYLAERSKRSYRTIIGCLEALRDEDEDKVEKMKKKTIDELTNSHEYGMEINKKRIKNCLLNCNGLLERAWTISIYVMSQFPLDLSAAFTCVETLKEQSDNRVLVYEGGDSIDENDDGIKFTYEDYELTLPLLGAFIGAKKLMQSGISLALQQSLNQCFLATLDDNCLADLAKVKSSNKWQFGENLIKFLKDIEPMARGKRVAG